MTRGIASVNVADGTHIARSDVGAEPPRALVIVVLAVIVVRVVLEPTHLTHVGADDV